MKKNSLKVKKTSEIVSLALNAIDDLDNGYQVNLLREIANIFINRSIYIVYINTSKRIFDLSCLKTDIVPVKSHKWYDINAIKVDNCYLSDIIRIFAKNEERTEIYFIDDLAWDEFIKQECRLKHNQYKAVLVLNDNGQTFINFNITDFNFEEVTAKINRILENEL